MRIGKEAGTGLIPGGWLLLKKAHVTQLLFHQGLVPGGPELPERTGGFISGLTGGARSPLLNHSHGMQALAVESDWNGSQHSGAMVLCCLWTRLRDTPTGLKRAWKEAGGAMSCILQQPHTYQHSMSSRYKDSTATSVLGSATIQRSRIAVIQVTAPITSLERPIQLSHVPLPRSDCAPQAVTAEPRLQKDNPGTCNVPGRAHLHRSPAPSVFPKQLGFSRQHR